MTLQTESQHESTPDTGIGSGNSPEEDNELDLDNDLLLTPGSLSHQRIVSLGSGEWGPDDLAQVRTFSEPGSISSLVGDAGFSLQQSDIAEDRPLEQSFELTGLGTQFENDVSRLHDALEHEKPKFLENWLRSNKVESDDRRGTYFLPIDKLGRIMTPENVYRELYQGGIREDVGSLTESLCSRGRTSRQRIFAILCMLILPAQIVEFVREEIYDSDLPFSFTNSGVYREITTDSGSSKKGIPLFQDPPWEIIHHELFEKYQHELSAPFFKLNWVAGEKTLHFRLKDRTVLPFMHVHETSETSELDATIQREGGTSIVRRVKIHPSHYNAHADHVTKEDIYVAVKEVQVRKGSDRQHSEDREALALKRLNQEHDPHLIRLLATYTYESRFHLIFPWADGNLKDLWETRSLQPLQKNPDAQSVKWMSSQILGLANALKKIHYCPIDKANIQGLSLHDQERPHGRHGDLKPENILWFKNEGGDHDVGSMGMLKIADFGFANFHSRHSRSNVRRSTLGGITETYRAPEYDVTQRISPQYDIWSLGCILLQFVVWYLHGWEGVDKFSKSRTADSRGALIAADIFFGLDNNNYKARTKQSVVEMFKTLKENHECSDYILDLLEYLQTDLLRVNKTKRAKIDEIVEKFQKLDADCHQVPGYCTNRTKQARRIGSGLSEIVEIPSPSGNEGVSNSYQVPSAVRHLDPRRPTSSGSHHEAGQVTEAQVVSQPARNRERSHSNMGFTREAAAGQRAQAEVPHRTNASNNKRLHFLVRCKDFAHSFVNCCFKCVGT